MPARSEPYDDPNVHNFANEVTAWREAAGLSKKELGDKLGFADTYIGQVEHSKNLPSLEFAQALDTFFKTNDMYQRSRKRIFEARKKAVLPPGFAEYVEREKDAMSAQVFSLILIHGLLQTEDYARTIINATEIGDIEELVAQRMDRQVILTRDEDPVYASFILDERALRNLIGDLEMHRAQLQHLIDLSRRPNVNIRVLPDRPGYHEGMAGGFTTLGFIDGTHIAYTESAGMGMLIEDPVRASSFLVLYGQVSDHALPVDDSRDLIKSLMEEL